MAINIISYIGSIISSAFLIITAITYLLSKKLHSSENGQLLIHMCLALIGLYISFLIAALLGNDYDKILEVLQKPICIAFSALVHYFFLVYFFVTVAQSLLLYLKLVRVLGTEELLLNYHKKVGLVCWITPLVIVGLFLGPTHDFYIQQPPNENVTSAVCFPSEWPLYLGVVTPFAVIYSFNVVMFIIILSSVLRHGKSKEKEGKAKKFYKKAVITFLLAIMFGVGWIFGVLGSTGIPEYISLPCQIIFVVIVGFQGLLIFLLHPCRSMEAREEWKKWLFYATCRAQIYKDNLKQAKVSQGHSASDHSATTRRTRVSSNPSSTTNTMAERYGATFRKHRPSPTPSPSSSRRPIDSNVGSANKASRYGCRSPTATSPVLGHSGSRRHSDTSSAERMAAKFGYRRRSSDSMVSVSQQKEKMLHTPGASLRPTTSPVSLMKIPEDKTLSDSDFNNDSSNDSQPSTQTPTMKPQIRQLFVFANNDDKPLAFSTGDTDSSSHYGNNMQYASNDTDLMCFSPESDSFNFASQEEENNIVTWQTFEYDDELQSGATTLFYNFEDDF